MFAQKCPGNGDGGDRDEGVQQRRIGRCRVLQRQVGKGVVAADTEQSEDQQWSPAFFQERPLRVEMGQGQWQDKQEGDEPSPE
jgi:hypothetical protein